MKIATGQRYLAQTKSPVRYSRRAPRHTQEFTTGLPANEVANVDRNLSDGIKKYSTKHWAPRTRDSSYQGGRDTSKPRKFGFIKKGVPWSQAFRSPRAPPNCA